MKAIHKDDQGAALVEFAVVAILLFTVLFGIIEAGWAFSNQLDVRHAARQGARVAAVVGNPADVLDADGERDAIVFSVCEAMKTPFRDGALIDIALINGGTDAEITVSAPSAGLTGFIGALNSLILKDKSTAFIEQTPEWVDTAGLDCASVGL